MPNPESLPLGGALRWQSRSKVLALLQAIEIAPQGIDCFLELLNFDSGAHWAAARRVVVHEHNYSLTVGAVSCKRMLGGGISLAIRQIPSRRSDSAT